MRWFSKSLSEEDLTLRARTEYNQKNYSKAEISLLKLKKITNDQTWANDVLARLFMNTGRHEDAIALFRNNFNLSENPQRELKYLIDCYRVTKRYEEAISLILESKLLNQNDDLIWQKTKRIIDEIEDSNLIQKFVNNLDDYQYENVNFDMIKLKLSRLNEDDNAIAIITSRIIGHKAVDISTHDALKLVNILKQSNNYSKALDILNTLEGSEEVNRQKIEIYRRTGDYQNALEIFEMNYHQNPTNDKTLISGMRLAWDTGNMKYLQKLSNEFLQHNPSNEIAMRFHLQSLVKLGEIEVLRDAIKSAIKVNPNYVEAYYMAINLALEEDKDYLEVLDLCEKVLHFEPKNRQALTKSVQALGKLDLQDEMLNASLLAQSILPVDDEVTLTAAQAEWQVESGKHIGLINSMLDRHNLFSIRSNDSSNSLAIENIRCDVETESHHKELVSVIMTVYGRDKYLDVAINSILSQTHKNLELIIVDDVSPDDSWIHLQDFAKHDSRIKLLQVEKNGGTYLAKNLGLTKAKGDYIAFMDSDDWTHPQRIERQISSLKSIPNSKAVWHKYFRIDENGNIIFRGKGAIRNACISLLGKKEIFEEIGFFDSLRVGADTEFIERIQAYFGKDSLIEDPIPSMFMLQHTNSLTGGGKFHISWRSITDYRLAHHSSFREWHRKISNGGESPYVSRILRIRPFNAPNEMLAGDSLWSEGMKLFGEEIQKRNHDWWKGKKPMWQKHLSEKIKGEKFVLERGIPVVPKFFITDSYEDRRFQELPDSYVIKTSVGYSANQVFPIKDGKNVFTDEDTSVDEVLDKLRNDSFVQNKNHTIIVEELVEDEFGYKFPLDYKFYMFGDNIAAIQVIDRPSKKTSEQSHAFYNENWGKIPINVLPVREDIDKFEKPRFFDEMKNAAKLLGEALGIFMRIDFYSTKDAFYFGEFTPTPGGGKGYSDEGNRYLGTFWEGDEGVFEV